MNKKIIVILFILLTLFVAFVPKKVEAQTLRDLYKELDVLNEKKAKQDKNKDQTEKEKISTNSEIVQSARDIETCSDKIIEATEEIEELNLEIGDKKEEIERLMRSLQVSNGGNVYLEYVFEATSFTDFIYRSAIVEQLTDYNDQLIEEMYNMIEENKQLQIDMNDKKKELESLNKSLNRKLISLDATLEDILDEQMSLADQIKMQKDVIKEYEKYGCKMDQDLNDCLNVPISKGFIKPLNKARMSSNYGFRYLALYGYTKFHDGLDMSGMSEGTPVYAAAAGVISLKYAYKGCGGYRIYISHIVNGVSYTTKYLHLLKFANVKFGDVVTANTIIGYVGGGSTATRNGGYDNCSTGTHLHFSIGEGLYSSRTGSSGISWVNPRTLLKFPKKGQWFYTR